ncbi:MAG: VWA domain-containing protein [Pyrinomonadaceae bacterium]
MKLQRLIVIFPLFVLTFCAATSVIAQDTEPTPPPLNIIEDSGEVVKIESRLVMVPVSVTDANGQPVTGLTEKDFRISENNKMQEITQVGDAEKVPLEIAILFDISGTTNPMFDFQQETAAKFLREVMRPEDRATIFTIGEDTVLVQARDTAERSAISIKTIRPTKQYTAFYDTVRAAADYLNNNTPSGRRKVVVVISDGEDTNSDGVRRGFQSVYASLGQEINTITTSKLKNLLDNKRTEIRIKEQAKVLKSLQNADTVFYSINPAGSSYRLNKISVFGQNNMEKFADETGGTAFLPKFLPIDVKDNYQKESNIRRNTETLEKIFSQLANELRAQYLVQYYSNNDFPENKYVDLNVALKTPNSYRLRARQGYYVKN